MQEEVEQKTITLTINAAKFTGRVLKQALSHFLAGRKQKSNAPTAKTGRVTMRQLQKQYGELRSINVDDSNTRQFERIARKYHVQYKVYRCEKGKYQIFFKAPNDAAMQAAFQEYVKKKLVKADRPPFREKLQNLREQIAATISEKVRRKERER